MSKSIPSELLAHYKGTQLTTAYLLKIVRSDGLIFAFTSASQDTPPISGIIYTAKQGLDVSNIVQSSGFGVDNLELTTLDDGSLFTRNDVLSGVWQGSKFFIYRYNWADITQGIENVTRGEIGNVKIQDNIITAEFRSLKQYFQQPIGFISSKNCRAHFADYPVQNGNARCGLNYLDYRDLLVVTSVVSRSQFVAIPYDSGVTTDSNYNLTDAILLFNGANNSTSIVDQSPKARTDITVVGSAVQKTAAGGGQVRFGSASLYLPGSGSCVYLGDNPNISFSGDFTIQGSSYITASNSSNMALLTLLPTGWELYKRGASSNALALWNGSSNVIIGGTSINANTWYDWAWVKSGSTHSIWLNAVSQGTYTNSSAIDSSAVILGSYNLAGTSDYMTGYYDNFRITTGVGRSISALTAEFPTAAPPPSTRAADWYTEGILVWVTGNNTNIRAVKVRLYDSSQNFKLLSAMPNNIQVGDRCYVIAGCRKRRTEDCSGKFGNQLNNQGEPDLPGRDLLTSSPTNI